MKFLDWFKKKNDIMMFITKNPDKYVQEIGLKNEIFISDSD